MIDPFVESRLTGEFRLAPEDDTSDDAAAKSGDSQESPGSTGTNDSEPKRRHKLKKRPPRPDRRPRRTSRRSRTPGEAEADLLRSVRLEILGRLIPHIAHDLNQPAGIARMAAENSLLDVEAGDADPSSLRRSLMTISDQMERVAELAAFAGALSRDDTGGDRDFDARAIVTSAVDRIVPFMRSLNFMLEVSLPEEGVAVRGNPANFQMAILAILLAAWDYLATVREPRADDGSGEPILVHGDCETGTFDLEIVCDAGSASTAGDNRAKLASSPPMVAVRVIAARMGGRFKLRARANSLHAHLSLPVLAAAPPQSRKKDKAEPNEPGAPARSAGAVRGKSAEASFSILLVDDEELALEGILAHLSRQGHTVTTARNGKEALEHFVADKPDLVVTDLRMPVMSGNVLIRRLRAIDVEVPIIVMTGHALPQDEEQATTDGASTVLRKPVRLRELTTIINSMVKRPGRAGSGKGAP